MLSFSDAARVACLSIPSLNPSCAHAVDCSRFGAFLGSAIDLAVCQLFPVRIFHLVEQ